MNIKSASPAPNAIILYANYACFGSGMTVKNGKVQSRMLLWCKSGKGRITVNGKSFEFSAGCFLFIPWNHYICYQADIDEPFLVAGIHIVPEMPTGIPLDYHIFHTERFDIPEYLIRKDMLIPGFSETFFGRMNDNRNLLMLAEYIVAWFQRQPKDEFMARNLAQSLIYELMQSRKVSTVSSGNYPSKLGKILDFIDANVESRIDVTMLAEYAGCSPPTVFRLFKEHLHCSPSNWILKQKVRQAMELLIKTNMHVKEIGGRVGIDDPYYFCKVFKKVAGITAGEFRRRNSLIDYKTHNISGSNE